MLLLLLVLAGWLFIGGVLVLFWSSVMSCLIGWDKFLPIMQFSMVFGAGIASNFFFEFFGLEPASILKSLRRNHSFLYFFYYVMPSLMFGFGCCVLSAIVLGPPWMVLSGIYAIGLIGGLILIPIFFED